MNMLYCRRSLQSYTVIQSTAPHLLSFIASRAAIIARGAAALPSGTLTIRYKCIARPRARLALSVQSPEQIADKHDIMNGETTMNELILSTTNAPAKFSFKNAKLNEISAKIAEQSAAMNSVYNAAKEGAEAVNKALAPLFGELMASKCYKDDGFKSVADYAEKTFGMSKSMAYMLARVGDTFYNTGSEEAKKARETLSTSKLAELTGVDKKDIGKALKDGKLTADTSLADCRDFATAHKKPGKEKVLPTFTVFAMTDKKTPVDENVTKEDMYEAIAYKLCQNAYVSDPAEVFFATVKLDGDKPSANQHFIAYTAGGFVRMYEYSPYVKKPLKSKGKGEKFDLKAYLAKLSPEERMELLQSLDGSDESEEA